MAVRTPSDALSVEAYLSSSFEGDRDFVDGRLEERILGEFDHSRVQGLIFAWFLRHEQQWDIVAVPEQRVQVSETRFRVPDVCVLRRGRPVEQIVHIAPLICVEVLSPEDTYSRLRARFDDYFGMGVEHVWVVNPAAREGLVCTQTGWNRPEGGRFVVRGTEIYLPIDEMFADLRGS